MPPKNYSSKIRASLATLCVHGFFDPLVRNGALDWRSLVPRFEKNTERSFGKTMINSAAHPDRPKWGFVTTLDPVQLEGHASALCEWQLP